LSNSEDFPGHHDEIDIEFLRTTPDKPYVLQTNVYMKGSGDDHLIGREMQFHLWFDPTKGSGFKSLRDYRSGYFGTSLKLQPGYTAGIITSFYLSNSEDFPGHHDEIDIEFLGTTPGKPYVLQTNVYMKGSGDGHIIGREMQFHLWFDPTKGFHNYAILWNPNEIIFFVDDVPIRRYPKKSDATFPKGQCMCMVPFGMLHHGLQRMEALKLIIVNNDGQGSSVREIEEMERYQPFIGKYNTFKIGGCTTNDNPSCHPPSGSPSRTGGLSRQ
ncbi:hypothetical protein KY289_026627, partial [Solanum tuberosum]